MKAYACLPNLILRSRAERGVSKDGNEHRACCPPFETQPFGPLLRVRLEV